MNIKEHRQKIEKEIKRLDPINGELGQKIGGMRDSAFGRYPLVFVLLSAFGLVATFYGFEKVIDNIPFFVENPSMILVTGIGILILTGTLFKKLH